MFLFGIFGGCIFVIAVFCVISDGIMVVLLVAMVILALYFLIF